VTRPKYAQTVIMLYAGFRDEFRRNFLAHLPLPGNLPVWNAGICMRRHNHCLNVPKVAHPKVIPDFRPILRYTMAAAVADERRYPCLKKTVHIAKFAVNNDYVVIIMVTTETTTSYHTIKRSGGVSRPTCNLLLSSF